MRRDLFQIIEHAKTRGLSVAVAPSATALVIKKRLRKLMELGVGAVLFGLDGATAEIHDAFRGVKGTFDRTLRMMALAREVGMPFQVNTTVSKRTVQDLPRLGELLTGYDPSIWISSSLSRPAELLSIMCLGHGDVTNWVLDNSENWKFRVKTTLAPHYRRAYILRKIAADSMSQVPEEARPTIRDGWPRPVTNDGRGTMFISHQGEIYPSGFLRLRTGIVWTDNLVDTYRSSPVIGALRDTTRLKGKCGVCQFNEVCGGSRTRAYGMTGDMLGTDPSCAYVPKVA